MFDRRMTIVLAMLIASAPPLPIDDATLFAMFPPDTATERETIVLADPDRILAKCEQWGRQAAGGGGFEITRVQIRHDAKWGILWRADVVSRRRYGGVFRFVCTSKVSLIRPLQMFDPAQSIPPLPR
jgi:hypothetical protein